MSQQMRDAWTAFATSGEPGWPTFDDGPPGSSTSSRSVADYPEQVSRTIWQDHPGVLDLV